MSTETTTGLSKVEVIRIGETKVGQAATEYVPAECEFNLSIGHPKVRTRFETTLFCAPHRLKTLVVGWLVGEGVLETEEEFNAIETNLDTLDVHVTVSFDAAARLAARAISGPVGRLSPPDTSRRADSSLTLTPDAVMKHAAAFKRLFLGLRSSERMCYLAAFARGDEIMSYGEGFHRVNALYRALGELVIARVATPGRIALMNFGLTKEMTVRLARAGACLAISAAPPSSAAIEAANNAYLCIATTAIGSQLTVYSAPWRIL
ncbi:MAG: formate dehydrogenase accessory sulfurtransferase FdhD [Planctomycetes bacterium]|nr:formate dehydrogenase accessory sulfurtransferase FdhD [Planctomycetota bacterium]